MIIQITDKDIKKSISDMKPVFLYRDDVNHINFHISFHWNSDVEPRMNFGFQVGNYSWVAPSDCTLHYALNEFHEALKRHDEAYTI